MPTPYYPPPVNQLLSLGEAHRKPWPHYADLGLTTAHIPDLIRMALDEELSNGAFSNSGIWAPVHAWRALGQMRVAVAIEPLTKLFHRVDDDQDDWVGEELPEVFGLIGAESIPTLTNYLADEMHGLWARVAALRSLEEIGKVHANTRSTIIQAVTKLLGSYAQQDPTFNAWLVDLLTEWHAVETAPLIEQVFTARVVDETVRGDWEDIQIALGLKAVRDTPKRSNWLFDLNTPRASPLAAPNVASTSQTGTQNSPSRALTRAAKARKKSERNQARQSRRKNRKKK